MTLQKWLVAGLGNPLLGCDGFGPAVVEHLKRRAGLPPQVEFADVHTDLLSVLDRFAAFDAVLLIDAVLGPATGGVSIFDEDVLSACDAGPAGCHAWSPLLAVKLFRVLHPAARTRFVLVGLVVDRLESGSPLKPADIDSGCAAVMRLLAEGGSHLVASAAPAAGAACGCRLYFNSQARDSDASDRNTNTTNPIA